MKLPQTARQEKRKQDFIASPEAVPRNKIQVFLVDDHPLIRIGINAIVNNELDMEVCGEAATIAQTMKLIARCKPDAISVDISLGKEDGIDLVKRILLIDPEIPILIYTMHEEESWMEMAMEAGAKAYVRKIEAAESLVKTIRTLARRREETED